MYIVMPMLGHMMPQHDAAKHYTACEGARGINYFLCESFRLQPVTHVRYCHNLSQVVLGYPGITILGTIPGCPKPEEPVDPGILSIPGFLG